MVLTIYSKAKNKFDYVNQFGSNPYRLYQVTNNWWPPFQFFNYSLSTLKNTCNTHIYTVYTLRGGSSIGWGAQPNSSSRFKRWTNILYLITEILFFYNSVCMESFISVCTKVNKNSLHLCARRQYNSSK